MGPRSHDCDNKQNFDFVTLKSVCNPDLGRKKAVAWSIRMTLFCCKTNQNGKFCKQCFFSEKDESYAAKHYASTIYQSLKMGGGGRGEGDGPQKITKRLLNEIVTQKHKHTNNNFSSFQNLW